MIKEIPQPNPRELPIPYEGVCGEVFFDLCSNPGQFIESTLLTMREENAPLTKYLISWFLASPNRQLSQEWTMAYYAIYSRSAKKSGSPMLPVSEDLINAFGQERTQVVKGLIPPENKQQQERLNAYFRSIGQQKDQLIEQEATNVELARFWAQVELWFAIQLQLGETPSEINKVLHPLDDLIFLLHRQEEGNRLTQRFFK